MPPITKNTKLKDPVSALARRIKRDGNDFSYGKTGPGDFVRWGCETFNIDPDYDRDEAIADAIDEDCGATIYTEEQLAAFIYARLTI
jgi:hypothetical protein